MHQIIENVKNSNVEEASAPWEKIGHWAVGGARAVGFSECSRYVLVESSNGRGLFDCSSGAKILRDNSEYTDKELELVCVGIGPIEGQEVRMSGLHGGGLPSCTKDGWHIESVSFWPQSNLLLFAPDSWLYGHKYGKPHEFKKIWSGHELRGYGFSYTGQALIVCESSDLIIYTKSTC